MKTHDRKRFEEISSHRSAHEHPTLVFVTCVFPKCFRGHVFWGNHPTNNRTWTKTMKQTTCFFSDLGIGFNLPRFSTSFSSEEIKRRQNICCKNTWRIETPLKEHGGMNSLFKDWKVCDVFFFVFACIAWFSGESKVFLTGNAICWGHVRRMHLYPQDSSILHFKTQQTSWMVGYISYLPPHYITAS